MTPDRCAAIVYVRDTYRRTGRTKSGFELHYERRRCHRKPVDGECCAQHKKMCETRGRQYLGLPPKKIPA